MQRFISIFFFLQSCRFPKDYFAVVYECAAFNTLRDLDNPKLGVETAKTSR
jgi:hypothetical protein